MHKTIKSPRVLPEGYVLCVLPDDLKHIGGDLCEIEVGVGYYALALISIPLFFI